MKFKQPLTISFLQTFLQATVLGSMDNIVYGINEIHRIEKGDICFVDHPKYYDTCLHSKADIILINTHDVTYPRGKTLLIVPQPFEAYLKIITHFFPTEYPSESLLHKTPIGKNSIIMPMVYIGPNVTIGNDCIIHAHVSLVGNITIGNHVVIQPNTVIGSDAFYYNSKKNREIWYKKMNSCGEVVIEDYVEIGANCTIDRGVTADTRIGKGTKIDNLVQIGHDTQIGKNCIIASQVGIAGGVLIEDGVTIWGQVGISKTLRIGHNATILAQTGVPSSLEANKVYFGYPAQEASEKRRELVWIKRIPQLWKKVMDK